MSLNFSWIEKKDGDSIFAEHVNDLADGIKESQKSLRSFGDIPAFVTEANETSMIAQRVATDVSALIDEVGNISSELNNKPEKSDIPTKVSELENDAEYVTKETLTETTLIADEAFKKAEEAKTIATHNAENKADKSELPQKVSELENDSGYLTEHQDISGKADKQNANGGFAGGESALVEDSGGAIGFESKTQQGGAAGDNAWSTSGGAMGYLSDAESGGAIGERASANNGGAIGYMAKATRGFSGGNRASSQVDAVQLGTGTNTNEKSLQVYSYTLMNRDGTIPSERMPQKADKTNIITDTESTSYTFDFSDMYNSEMRLQAASTISIIFVDNEYSLDYISGLSFNSGDTPTGFDYTESGIINWVGTDCTTSNGLSIFQPSPNTHYDIVFYYNGNQFIGLVNGFVPSTGNVVSE